VTPQYSIVIPAYNESARIGRALTEVLRTLDEQHWDAEVLVVNDGSTDNTAAIVESFVARDQRVRLLQNGTNRGKGYSVRNGLLHSGGNIVMFTDADLSSPMPEAERLFAAIRDGADVAIGSRWLETSRQTIHQPLYRQFFGRCFNVVTRMIMRLPFADTQCGFKAFRRGAAQTIFRLQRIERWGFDPGDSLHRAQARLQHQRGSGHVGPRRAVADQLSARRHQDAGRADCTFAGTRWLAFTTATWRIWPRNADCDREHSPSCSLQKLSSPAPLHQSKAPSFHSTSTLTLKEFWPGF
jgi:dolichyl-phosphate beta-glucosyltransferase